MPTPAWSRRAWTRALTPGVAMGQQTGAYQAEGESFLEPPARPHLGLSFGGVGAPLCGIRQATAPQAWLRQEHPAALVGRLQQPASMISSVASVDH